MSDFFHVETTTPTRDAGLELLRTSVKERLAASGQVLGPVAGAWWHNGEYGEGEEWVVLLKTTEARRAELEKHLLEVHPWDNPEITVVPIDGPARYLDWITQSTAS